MWASASAVHWGQYLVDRMVHHLAVLWASLLGAVMVFGKECSWVAESVIE